MRRLSVLLAALVPGKSGHTRDHAPSSRPAEKRPFPPLAPPSRVGPPARRSHRLARCRRPIRPTQYGKSLHTLAPAQTQKRRGTRPGGALGRVRPQAPELRQAPPRHPGSANPHAGAGGTGPAGRGHLRGSPGGRRHESQDIFAAKGTPVYSATEGYVWRLGNGQLGGLYVFVVGPGGRRYYAHLDRYAEKLKEGQKVTTRTGNRGQHRERPYHPGAPAPRGIRGLEVDLRLPGTQPAAPVAGPRLGRDSG
ncbi:MAG TPA: M23 family metallopeptidase [Meiothermus sp.]|nr:M23 family metallopeptidase [Meiothermus sp.]